MPRGDPGLPQHWQLLTENDQKAYLALRKFIQPLTIRTTRKRLSARFNFILQQIFTYISRAPENAWKRSLCCGVAKIGADIAVSTRQMCTLLGKCKSSINIGFQALGYRVVATSTEHATQLMKTFPMMMENSVEMRQWTMRSKKGDGQSDGEAILEDFDCQDWDETLMLSLDFDEI